MIQVGFLLVLFGSFLDVTDNFEALNPYVVIGDTETEAFLEKVVGYLFGFIFLTVGLVRWGPTVENLMKEVSDRKAAEDQSRLLLNAVGEGVIGSDVQGKVTFTNPAGCKILGFSEEELVGHSLHEVVHHSYSDGSHYPFEECPLFATINNGSIENTVDEVLWRKNGSSFPADYTSTPMHKDGNVIGAVITFRDITKRQAAEKTKSDFISTVSHELRTPLTSIKGVLGLIMAGAFDKSPEKLQPMVKIANDNSERLNLLINDLLDVEQFDAGKLTFKMVHTNLTLLVEEAIKANAGYADKYGVTLVSSPDDPSLTVNADWNRMMQVMANLFSNAVKFSQRGGNVEVSVSRHNERIRIAVKDYGSGIPEEARPKIFDRFTQADSSDQRAKGGTGLGLNITKTIVEGHGGTISFTSEMGKGTTFYIDLEEAEAKCEQQTFEFDR